MRLKVLASLSGAGAWPALWTCPALLASAFLVTWGAEAAQSVLGRGLALALLAWLQTLPEFGVEAVIAWRAGEDPARASLAIANLTGAIRLLVGLGWPLVYVVQATARWRRRLPALRALTLTGEDAVGVAALVPPLAYFAVVLVKGSLTATDAAVLVACYVGYLIFAARTPPKESAVPISAVARWTLATTGWRRHVRIGTVCLAGTALLAATVRPFFTSMLAVAAVLGIAPFLVVQWLAPVLTEVPELVSSVAWARREATGPMALMNLVASNVNQWTVLAGTIPIVFGFAHWRAFGTWGSFALDAAQRLEVLLALLQTAVGVALLASGAFGAGAAAGLFGLWVVEVAVPALRPAVAYTYGGGLAVLAVRLVAQRAFKRGETRAADQQKAGSAERDPADH
ncbi:MAG TPA: hypothetical protein VN848_08820 [Gemmatimonadales bacterium]|nr:hypothetical protein [Gemmatimonadales bacterium]